MLAHNRFPFLDYASMNGIFHADAAAGFGIEQIEYVDNFSLTHWISFCKVFKPWKFVSPDEIESALHVFASQNVGNLVHLECEKHRNQGIQREDYDNPLTDAISYRNEKAIRTLLTPAGSLQPENQQPYLSDERH